MLHLHDTQAVPYAATLVKKDQVVVDREVGLAGSPFVVFIEVGHHFVATDMKLPKDLFEVP